MNILITGGAGFVGSHLVERLAANPENKLTIVDNFRTGKKEFIEGIIGKGKAELIKGDLRKQDFAEKVVEGKDIIYHLAANADVRGGVEDTKVDLEVNFLVTYNLLEGVRKDGNAKDFVFISSTQIYGEADEIPTPEDYGPLKPINIYGASKLAAEGYICAYANSFGFNAHIFRPVGISGKRGTHGIIPDLIEKLKKDPSRLQVFGDGTQLKSYIHISDLLEGMEFAIEKGREKVGIYNLGSEDWVAVKRIAEIVVEEMNLKNVRFNYTGGDRGWVGDVPKVQLSIEKLKKMGWKPKYNSEQAVRKAARELIG